MLLVEKKHTKLVHITGMVKGQNKNHTRHSETIPGQEEE